MSEVFSLGEVVRPNRPRVKPESMPDAPFIGMEHVEAHTMKLLGTVPASTMKSSAVHFKAGDVLYGRLRPYLNKVYRPTFEGLCSAEFIVFPENERIDGRYLQYFLNSGTFVQFATHLNAGDRPRVDFDQIAPYKIPVPSLARQREIVAELEKQFSRLDEAVANLQRVKANLKRYKASVLKAAVEGRLVETEATLEFRGKAYVRNGTSKAALSGYPDKERAIWTRRVDWSAQVCEQATLADLDPLAIAEARRQFAEKNKTKPDRLAELAAWDDATFLNKAKLTVRGSITNAALLLLGREESTSLLAPAVARISWILKNERNEELDYEHFGPPMLLNVNKVLARIRNLTVRELPDGTLFPVELTQYDPWVIREALHNCIAHQDYGLRGRIQVVETPQALLLTNVGGFLPGRVETVIDQDAPLEIYRNPYLAEAMVSLNMIDTQGGGIKRMFQTQRRRFFPMPDYDLTQPERVMVTLRGRILDVRYTRLLMAQGELDLGTIMLLDKVQKGQRIDADEAKRLKAAKLVEGRYPNLLVAGSVAAATGDKAQHIRNRGFDNRYYRDLIVDLVREHQPVSREDIDKLLLTKLPEVLSAEQKASKVHNLLASLSGQRIQNVGTRQASKWILMQSICDD